MKWFWAGSWPTLQSIERVPGKYGSAGSAAGIQRMWACVLRSHAWPCEPVRNVQTRARGEVWNHVHTLKVTLLLWSIPLGRRFFWNGERKTKSTAWRFGTVVDRNDESSQFLTKALEDGKSTHLHALFASKLKTNLYKLRAFISISVYVRIL